MDPFVRAPDFGLVSWIDGARRIDGYHAAFQNPTKDIRPQNYSFRFGNGCQFVLLFYADGAPKLNIQVSDGGGAEHAYLTMDPSSGIQYTISTAGSQRTGYYPRTYPKKGDFVAIMFVCSPPNVELHYNRDLIGRERSNGEMYNYFNPVRCEDARLVEYHFVNNSNVLDFARRPLAMEPAHLYYGAIVYVKGKSKEANSVTAVFETNDGTRTSAFLGSPGSVDEEVKVTLQILANSVVSMVNFELSTRVHNLQKPTVYLQAYFENLALLDVRVECGLL